MDFTYRRGTKDDYKAILQCADNCFIPVRTPSFDFAKVMPKVYNPEFKYAGIHHLVIKDGKIVSLVGNLIQPYNLNGHTYNVSFIGTMGVLPEYKGQGYMKFLIGKTQEENKEKKIPFSILTGQRNRYEYFGYYLTGMEYSFEFVRGNIVHSGLNRPLKDLKAEAFKKDETEALYDIYLHNIKLQLRTQENFVSYCLCHQQKIVVLKDQEEIVGYCLINKKGIVSELMLKDSNFLLDAVNAILDETEKDEITILAEERNSLFAQMRYYAENYSIEKSLIIKAYDYAEFLRFAFDFNAGRPFSDGRAILQVEGQKVLIEIKEGKVSISDTEENPNVILTPKEFFSLFSLDSMDREPNNIPAYWFPLGISMYHSDTF